MSRFPNRKVFEEKYSGNTDSQILREILFDLKVNIHKNELVRSNVSKLVVWIIVIPLFITGLVFFMALIGVTSG